MKSASKDMTTTIFWQQYLGVKELECPNFDVNQKTHAADDKDCAATTFL